MADGGPNQDAVRVEGGQLRVDARAALLVAQLQSSGGEPYVTVRNEGGSLHRAVPSNVRTGTYRLGEDVTVEAVRGSSFVAVEEGGRHLVAAFQGEVVLRAGADGERLALAPNEGVLVPAGGGEPQVIPLSDAGGDPELASMIDRVTDAMAAPDAATAPAAAAPTPASVPPPITETASEPEPKTPPAAAAAAAATPPAVGPSRQASKKGKKGKKARQRQAQQQQRPTSPQAAKAAGAAAPVAAASTPAPEKAAGAEKTPPIKKVAPPRKTQGATKKRAAPTGGGRPPGGESSNTGRRVVAVVVALAAVLAAVVVLTQSGRDDDTLATGDTTTTAETSSTSETSAPAGETSTTAPPETTSTTEAPTTTTTARATTTTAAPVANYKFEPRTCVQSGNTITYTASITNQGQSTFDYLVRVRFVDKNGAEVAAANASVNDVRPGQTREVRATGTAARDLRDSGATCAVTAVEPTAS